MWVVIVIVVLLVLACIVGPLLIVSRFDVNRMKKRRPDSPPWMPEFEVSDVVDAMVEGLAEGVAGAVVDAVHDSEHHADSSEIGYTHAEHIDDSHDYSTDWDD